MVEPLRFETVPALAQWLALDPAELWWFADVEGLARHRASGPLSHYHYRFEPKSDGSARLLEIPKLRLKVLQRRIANRLLASAPVHDAAHGFVRGRSFVGGARHHVGRALVMRIDLREFFASISAARVRASFTALGHADAVARVLTGLCTNATPRAIWRELSPSFTHAARRELWRRRERHALAHLPAGAPTSPTLANLAAWRLDARLAGLARVLDATYTRYADDLTFSGDDRFARDALRSFELVCRIVAEEGFVVNARKTRMQRAGRRQEVTGIVVNARTSLPRRELERLEAMLYNCARSGPSEQNRARHPDFRAHLAGRIAHVAAVHPERAAWLRELFARIDWAGPA